MNTFWICLCVYVLGFILSVAGGVLLMRIGKLDRNEDWVTIYTTAFLWPFLVPIITLCLFVNYIHETLVGLAGGSRPLKKVMKKPKRNIINREIIKEDNIPRIMGG